MKNFIVGVVGMASAIPIMGYYPFGASYVAAIMASRCKKRWYVLIALIALYLGCPKLVFAKYALEIIAFISVMTIFENMEVKVNACTYIATSVIAFSIMEIIDASLLGFGKGDAFIVAGLAVLVASMGFIMYEIIRLVLIGEFLNFRKKPIALIEFAQNEYERKMNTIGNEFVKLSSKLEKFQNGNEDTSNMASTYIREMGNIIKMLARDVLATSYDDEKLEERIFNELRRNSVKIKQINIVKKNCRKEISLTILDRVYGGSKRYKKDKERKLKEIAEIISESLGEEYVFSENGVTENTYIFRQKQKYYTMFGMAKKSYNDEACGDNFSYQQLECGQTFMGISDGMGTGEEASKESQFVIEIIEELKELGLSEELILGLLNMVFIDKYKEVHPASVDLSVIDMYSGVCDMIKSGAATTFLKRGDWVEAIKSTSLPIGATKHVDVEKVRRKLYDGDLLIMVSDGIIDSVEHEDQEKFITDMILDSKSLKPKELAKELLNGVLKRNDYNVLDDMTVMVAGIWNS